MSKTKDKKIVTAHGNPLKKYLTETQEEYLHKYPESLTIQELFDWIYHHPTITLYLELKSPITIEELLHEIEYYAKGKNNIVSTLYKQIMVYTHDLQIIKKLITEKQKFCLSTLQLRIFWVAMSFISNNDIDMISSLGTDKCRIYGIEQGTVPWGFKPFSSFMHMPLPPFVQIKKRLGNIKKIVTYAQEKQLKFIIGTVDDIKLIRMLIEQGVNGVVPNNPLKFYEAGIRKENNKKNAFEPYIPLSMKARLSIK